MSPPPAPPPVRHVPIAGRVLTIRRQILLAFLAMAAMTGLFGWSAVRAITESGGLVVEAFDRSLMSVSHARAAQSGFAGLQGHVVAAMERVAGAETFDPEAAAEAVLEDLGLARARALSDPTRAAAAAAAAAVRDWASRARDAIAAGEPLEPYRAATAAAGDQFEMLVNFVAGDAFRGRQRSVEAIRAHRDRAIAIVAVALVFSAAVTFLLARRIVGRVEAASRAAAGIAGGALDVAIPVAGADEVGRLLQSMTVMRDNIRDMVERERAQRRSAQRRLLDAIEGSREGVVLVDSDGAILLANSQARAFLPGLDAQFAGGARYAALLDAAVAQRRFRWESPAEAAALRARLGTADAAVSEEQLADGRWLRLSRSAASDGGLVAIWSEITAIKEREGVLRTAKERAEAANRAKTEFLANMSHELRTPLNAVIGFSEMMEAEMLGPIGTPKYKEFSGDILRSGRHLLAIINDILALAKSEAGRLTLDVAPVRLDELVQASARMMEPAARQAGLALAVVAPPAWPTIEGDPVKVKQVLLNLLSNAIKFTPSGGRVALEVATSAAGVTLTVRDTGIGMAPDHIPIALAPFGQVDSRLARKYEGTGLGLPLTKAFVELHGGTLAIRSALGQGTAVDVTFPAALPLRRAA